MGSNFIAVLGKPEEIWAAFNGLDQRQYVHPGTEKAAAASSMGEADKSVLDLELHEAGVQDGQAIPGKTQEVQGQEDAKGHQSQSGPEAGQATGEHGVQKVKEQKVGPVKRKLDTIELIDKQVKEKVENLQQKKLEIKIMVEKKLFRHAQPSIQQKEMLEELKRNYEEQKKVLDQIKDLNDERNAEYRAAIAAHMEMEEAPCDKGGMGKPKIKKQRKEKVFDEGMGPIKSEAIGEGKQKVGGPDIVKHNKIKQEQFAGLLPRPPECSQSLAVGSDAATSTDCVDIAESMKLARVLELLALACKNRTMEVSYYEGALNKLKAILKEMEEQIVIKMGEANGRQ